MFDLYEIFSKLYDKYYEGHRQDPFHPEIPPPSRPWYYFLVCIAVWILYPFNFIGGMFYLIVCVIRGDIELPPDYGSYIGFAILSAIFLLLILSAIGLSFYFWVVIF